MSCEDGDKLDDRAQKTISGLISSLEKQWSFEKDDSKSGKVRKRLYIRIDDSEQRETVS
jgi:hypothetical protein